MSEPLIRWRDEFSLGIPSVDHEHRELIGLINEVHESLVNADAQTPIVEFLGELFAQISAHFALEERIMRDAGYDEFPAHKGDHERLLDEIRDLMDDYESGAAPDIERFARKLDDWFSVHFRTHDARLHKRLG